MSTRAHAKLSASGAHRWMSCPPSAQLESEFQDEQSPYAAEGTFAHELAELKLSRAIANTVKPSTFTRRLNKLKENEWYTAELEDHVDQYVAQVSEIFLAAKAKCNDPVVMLEERLDFSAWVPGGFGTGDVVIISDDAIEVIDLKFGKGVVVSAEGNPQMRLYGLGAAWQYAPLYGFNKVRTTIIQPRLDNISTEELDIDSLYAWADDEVIDKADLAINGEGEYCAGEHCRFCKARFTCRTRAESNLELAKFEFKQPPVLSINEIGEVLAKAGGLAQWAADIAKFALEQAERHGVKFPGWKLVEGRSNRRYTDTDSIIKVLHKNDYDPDATQPRSLIGITAMEKLLGKKKFAELLSDYIDKPAGKPTLVPEADKRPEIGSADGAVADFAEEVPA